MSMHLRSQRKITTKKSSDVTNVSARGPKVPLTKDGPKMVKRQQHSLLRTTLKAHEKFQLSRISEETENSSNVNEEEQVPKVMQQEQQPLHMRQTYKGQLVVQNQIALQQRQQIVSNRQSAKEATSSAMTTTQRMPKQQKDDQFLQKTSLETHHTWHSQLTKVADVPVNHRPLHQVLTKRLGPEYNKPEMDRDHESSNSKMPQEGIVSDEAMATGEPNLSLKKHLSMNIADDRMIERAFRSKHDLEAEERLRHQQHSLDNRRQHRSMASNDRSPLLQQKRHTVKDYQHHEMSSDQLLLEKLQFVFSSQNLGESSEGQPKNKKLLRGNDADKLELAKPQKKKNQEGPTPNDRLRQTTVMQPHLKADKDKNLPNSKGVKSVKFPDHEKAKGPSMLSRDQLKMPSDQQRISKNLQMNLEDEPKDRKLLRNNDADHEKAKGPSMLSRDQLKMPSDQQRVSKNLQMNLEDEPKDRKLLRNNDADKRGLAKPQRRNSREGRTPNDRLRQTTVIESRLKADKDKNLPKSKGVKSAKFPDHEKAKDPTLLTRDHHLMMQHKALSNQPIIKNRQTTYEQNKPREGPKVAKGQAIQTRQQQQLAMQQKTLRDSQIKMKDQKPTGGQVRTKMINPIYEMRGDLTKQRDHDLFTLTNVVMLKERQPEQKARQTMHEIAVRDPARVIIDQRQKLRPQQSQHMIFAQQQRQQFYYERDTKFVRAQNELEQKRLQQQQMELARQQIDDLGQKRLEYQTIISEQLTIMHNRARKYQQLLDDQRSLHGQQMKHDPRAWREQKNLNLQKSILEELVLMQNKAIKYQTILERQKMLHVEQLNKSSSKLRDCEFANDQDRYQQQKSLYEQFISMQEKAFKTQQMLEDKRPKAVINDRKMLQMSHQILSDQRELIARLIFSQQRVLKNCQASLLISQQRSQQKPESEDDLSELRDHKETLVQTRVLIASADQQKTLRNQQRPENRTTLHDQYAVRETANTLKFRSRETNVPKGFVRRNERAINEQQREHINVANAAKSKDQEQRRDQRPENRTTLLDQRGIKEAASTLNTQSTREGTVRENETAISGRQRDHTDMENDTMIKDQEQKRDQRLENQTMLLDQQAIKETADGLNTQSEETFVLEETVTQKEKSIKDQQSEHSDVANDSKIKDQEQKGETLETPKPTTKVTQGSQTSNDSGRVKSQGIMSLSEEEDLKEYITTLLEEDEKLIPKRKKKLPLLKIETILETLKENDDENRRIRNLLQLKRHLQSCFDSIRRRDELMIPAHTPFLRALSLDSDQDLQDKHKVKILLDLPSFDFRSYFRQWMESDIVARSLQAKLRSDLIESFHRSKLGKSLCGISSNTYEPRRNAFCSSSVVMALNALLAEFLFVQNCHFTLSVYCTEIPFHHAMPNFETRRDFRFRVDEIKDILHTVTGNSIPPACFNLVETQLIHSYMHSKQSLLFALFKVLNDSGKARTSIVAKTKSRTRDKGVMCKVLLSPRPTASAATMTDVSTSSIGVNTSAVLETQAKPSSARSAEKKIRKHNKATNTKKKREHVAHAASQTVQTDVEQRLNNHLTDLAARMRELVLLCQIPIELAESSLKDSNLYNFGHLCQRVDQHTASLKEASLTSDNQSFQQLNQIFTNIRHCARTMEQVFIHRRTSPAPSETAQLTKNTTPDELRQKISRAQMENLARKKIEDFTTNIVCAQEDLKVRKKPVVTETEQQTDLITQLGKTVATNTVPKRSKNIATNTIPKESKIMLNMATNTLTKPPIFVMSTATNTIPKPPIAVVNTATNTVPKRPVPVMNTATNTAPKQPVTVMNAATNTVPKRPVTMMNAATNTVAKTPIFVMSSATNTTHKPPIFVMNTATNTITRPPKIMVNSATNTDPEPWSVYFRRILFKRNEGKTYNDWVHEMIYTASGQLFLDRVEAAIRKAIIKQDTKTRKLYEIKLRHHRELLRMRYRQKGHSLKKSSRKSREKTRHLLENFNRQFGEFTKSQEVLFGKFQAAEGGMESGTATSTTLLEKFSEISTPSETPCPSPQATAEANLLLNLQRKLRKESVNLRNLALIICKNLPYEKLVFSPRWDQCTKNLEKAVADAKKTISELKEESNQVDEDFRNFIKKTKAESFTKLKLPRQQAPTEILSGISEEAPLREIEVAPPPPPSLPPSPPPQQQPECDKDPPKIIIGEEELPIANEKTEEQTEPVKQKIESKADKKQPSKPKKHKKAEKVPKKKVVFENAFATAKRELFKNLKCFKPEKPRIQKMNNLDLDSVGIPANRLNRYDTSSFIHKSKSILDNVEPLQTNLFQSNNLFYPKPSVLSGLFKCSDLLESSSDESDINERLGLKFTSDKVNYNNNKNKDWGNKKEYNATIKHNLYPLSSSSSSSDSMSSSLEKIYNLSYKKYNHLAIQKDHYTNDLELLLNKEPLGGMLTKTTKVITAAGHNFGGSGGNMCGSGSSGKLQRSIDKMKLLFSTNEGNPPPLTTAAGTGSCVGHQGQGDGLMTNGTGINEKHIMNFGHSLSESSSTRSSTHSGSKHGKNST